VEKYLFENQSEKSKRVLFIDEYNSFNDGEMARVLSVAMALRVYQPDIDISILSSSSTLDVPRYKTSNITVIKRPWHKDGSIKADSIYFAAVATFMLLWYGILRMFGKRGKLHQYDLYIHLTGDVINDRGLLSLFYHLYHLFFALLSGKKTVICAESLGPFNSKVTGFITRLIIGRLDLITIREVFTAKYLNKIGLSNSKVVITGDPAFLLEPTTVVSPKKPDGIVLGVTGNPDVIPYLSGFVPSSYTARYHAYAQLLADAIDNFIDHHENVSVLLISHVFRQISNDIKMHETIYSKIIHKDKVQLLRKYYTADEVKGVIALCDIFVGSRMHATIAAVSTGVPTVAVGHAHKFQGVLGDLLSQESLIDIRGINYDILSSKIESAIEHTWNNRQVITKRLNERLENQKKKSLLNGMYLINLLNSNT
jgi:polysaccharide pyruvyl transferase WcaK-like protein